MLARAVILAAGVSGAVGLSQLPEFSQQYVQRLGGAVDELRLFVADFDRDAASVGLSRSEALIDLAQGSALGLARAETMGEKIDRLERLEAGLETLRAAGPYQRAYQSLLVHDRDTALAVWRDFKPAVPVTFEGVVFAAVGFIAAGSFGAVVLALLKRTFRRRKPAQGPA